jgi:hypothetical protein
MRRAARALFLVALALTSVAAAELSFTKHALARMSERGVSQEQVREIIETVKPFKYRHQGRPKTGYYDEKSRVFVAADGRVVITVIANVTPRYISNLKRNKP